MIFLKYSNLGFSVELYKFLLHRNLLFDLESGNHENIVSALFSIMSFRWKLAILKNHANIVSLELYFLPFCFVSKEFLFYVKFLDLNIIRIYICCMLINWMTHSAVHWLNSCIDNITEFRILVYVKEIHSVFPLLIRADLSRDLKPIFEDMIYHLQEEAVL